jgi:C1q domain
MSVSNNSIDNQVTANNFSIDAGNLNMPNTSSTEGIINFNGSRFVHNYQTNNTFVGNDTGNFTLTGSQNAGIGTNALNGTTSGSNNTALGYGAGAQLSSGGSNTALGSAALFSGTSAAKNIAIGNTAMNALVSGSENIGIGYGAATAYSGAESNNIIIGNAGVISESNQIRIGTQGSGTGQQDACNIAGIYGSSVTSAGSVVVDSSGNLGSTTGPLVLSTQPAFQAYLSATVNDVTGDGTSYNIAFNGTVYDQASNFNTGTGVFTAPVTGVYLFTANIVALNFGAAHTAMQQNIVATGTTIRSYLLNPVTILTGTNLSLTNSAFVFMNSGDTCLMNIIVSGSTKTININGGNSSGGTYFSGALIC